MIYDMEDGIIPYFSYGDTSDLLLHLGYDDEGFRRLPLAMDLM